MLIVLVLGAGTDYGLFLVFRVREQLRDGADPKDAVLMPCTVLLLGRWNWWPSAMGRTGSQPDGPGEEGTERDTQPAAPRVAD
jgi:uncharacterized membrane protein YdfJ with MMPL/SSD domain